MSNTPALAAVEEDDAPTVAVPRPRGRPPGVGLRGRIAHDGHVYMGTNTAAEYLGVDRNTLRYYLQERDPTAVPVYRMGKVGTFRYYRQTDLDRYRDEYLTPQLTTQESFNAPPEKETTE